MPEYVKNFDAVVTADSEEEAEAAFVRSGLHPDSLIGEAEILTAEPAEEM